MEKLVANAIESEFGARFQGSLACLAKDLNRAAKLHGGILDGPTLRICFEPKYGQQYSSCIVYGGCVQPLPELPIPAFYRSILSRFNGAKLYALDFFGLPEDQSNQRRCLSLEHANAFWIKEYNGLPPGSFHFGGRPFSDEENLGYFYNSRNQVFAARKSGVITNTWPSLEAMLHEEWELLKRTEIDRRKSIHDFMTQRNIRS
jgi:hypothetical protein